MGDNLFLILNEKIKVIIIFVLCGFVNLSLVVMFIGGFGSLVFKKKDFIVRFVLKVVFVGMFFNFMSVIIVGLFIGLNVY